VDPQAHTIWPEEVASRCALATLSAPHGVGLRQADVDGAIHTDADDPPQADAHALCELAQPWDEFPLKALKT
jgi:hypothetical protein